MTGFSEQIRSNSKYLKSPIFFVHLIVFTVGNCIVTLSLAVMNDVICLVVDGDQDQYQFSQSQFEIIRVIVSVTAGPVIGILTDQLVVCWKDIPKSRVNDVKKITPLFIGVIIVNIATAISFIIQNILMLTYVFLSLATVMVYTLENIGQCTYSITVQYVDWNRLW